MTRVLAIAAAVMAAAVVAVVSIGSWHREAPDITLDPTADDTDVYAFTAQGRAGRADGRGQLDPVRGSGGRAELLPVRRPRAHYYINVDNTGDGKYDVRYRFKFKTHDPEHELVPVRAARA